MNERDGLLLGRAAEQRQLASVLDGVLAGRPGALVLVGEAGIGKSALAAHTAARAAAAGIRTVTGQGVPLTIEQPLQPMVSALSQLGVAGDGRGRTLFEATVGDPVSLLVQATIDQLDEVTGDEPLLLVLEDLHWADPATLTVVHHLATRRHGAPVAVVATTRPPGPGTPLHHLLTGIAPRVLELDGLAPEELDALAQCTLGRPPGPAMRVLVATSEGNPMIAEVLIAAAVSHGDVGDDPLVAELISPRPVTAGGPVAAQVAALAPSVLRVVQVAAMSGGPLRIDQLARLSGRGPADVLTDAEVAVQSGVLRRVDGDLEFRHELHRAAVLATLPASAQRAIHLEIARDLDDIGAPSLEIAEHLARGAQPGNRVAVEKLTATADDVVGHDPATALRVSELALGLVADPEAPPRLQVVRVGALAACGQAAEADLLGRALLRSPLPAETEGRLRRDLALAAVVDGRSADASTHMMRVVEIAPDRQAAARARTELAWAQLLTLEHEAASDGADLGAADGDDRTRIAALALQCWLGLWRLEADRARAAVSALEELVATAPLGEWQVFQPLLAAGAVHLELGQLEHSRVALERGRRLALDSGATWGAPAHDAMTAAIELRRGDLDAAVERATCALDETALVDGLGVEVWSRSQLARVALLRDDVTTAELHVEAAQLAETDGRAQLGHEQLTLAESGVLEQRGDPAAALAALCDRWDLLGAIGALYLRGELGVAMVRLGATLGDRTRADEVVETLSRDAARAGLPGLVVDAARAAAWATGTPSAITTAVTAARSTDNPVLVLETLRHATAILGRSDARSAAGYADEAAAVARRLGLAVDAGRQRTAARQPRPAFGPDSLTPAERRVADLVVEGLTNAHIASRLVVSRRTVDTQVLAVYRKLGVRSRVELTRALLLPGGIDDASRRAPTA